MSATKTTITRAYTVAPRDAERCGKCPSRITVAGNVWVCLPFAGTVQMGPRFAALRCDACKRHG